MNELNLKSSTVEKGLDLAKELMSKLLGPAINEMGELWADKVKVWRFKNQLKNFEKVKLIVEQQHVKVKEASLKVLLPYMEGVSLEDNETLQDMWANLLVNYIDADKNLTTNVYPGILAQLSSEEVKILNELKDFIPPSSITPRYFAPKPVKQLFEVDQVLNLERLGLIEGVARFKTVDTRRSGVYRPTSDVFKTGDKIEQLSPLIYKITLFGKQFLQACERGTDSSATV